LRVTPLYCVRLPRYTYAKRCLAWGTAVCSAVFLAFQWQLPIGAEGQGWQEQRPPLLPRLQ
jgi:hypothetical protein